MFRNLFITKDLKRILEKPSAESSPHLRKHLGVKDLTAFGIAAIIGAGIFSTIGQASASGGPAVILLFLFTALACGFAAFCYAEFASMVPLSGSAYTYSYVAFGEFFAWIIGWGLIMEYAIGNVVVAISWSGYFTHFLEHLKIPFLGFEQGIHLPAWSTIDYFSARSAALSPEGPTAAAEAWNTAPRFLGVQFIMNIPAMLINILITILVYRGIKESRNASNVMVAIKLSVVVLVILAGFFYVDFNNWIPFMPEGIKGVMAGASAVFFAYIGFDAISTTAEECHNPQRDLPKGMFYALLICTVLYMLIALVLTGMVPYSMLAVDDPLAFVFGERGLHWISGVIAVSAIVAMASVMLVFHLGQPRIWMSMSRDGLLPPRFATVNPRTGTPGFATIVTGLLVGIPLLFIDMNTVIDLCSIGTLFAFILVCGGILILQNRPEIRRAYRVPYVNGKWIVPLLFLTISFWLITAQKEWLNETMNPQLVGSEGIPEILFFVCFLILALASFRRSLSLIPVLGILCCLYIMAQINIRNWIGFLLWLVLGLLIYFGYSYKNSVLRRENAGILKDK